MTIGCVQGEATSLPYDEAEWATSAKAESPLPLPDKSCSGLYGSPNSRTGLGTDACFESIRGGATWRPRVWNESALSDLLSWKLDNSPQAIDHNPYETSPTPKPNSNAVCAVRLNRAKHSYRLITHSAGSVQQSVNAAKAAGDIITHGGACGACSSLADLEVYARVRDQTEPVRRCGLKNIFASINSVDACIQRNVGFTPACSRIWAYNTVNDRKKCALLCLGSTAAKRPYNLKNGSLNLCLQCDEKKSGPVFKAIAGRTRRNAGIASAICRPCDTVWRIDHIYK